MFNQKRSTNSYFTEQKGKKDIKSYESVAATL